MWSWVTFRDESQPYFSNVISTARYFGIALIMAVIVRFHLVLATGSSSSGDQFMVSFDIKIGGALLLVPA